VAITHSSKGSEPLVVTLSGERFLELDRSNVRIGVAKLQRDLASIGNALDVSATHGLQEMVKRGVLDINGAVQDSLVSAYADKKSNISQKLIAISKKFNLTSINGKQLEDIFNLDKISWELEFAIREVVYATYSLMLEGYAKSISSELAELGALQLIVGNMPHFSSLMKSLITKIISGTPRAFMGIISNASPYDMVGNSKRFIHKYNGKLKLSPGKTLPGRAVTTFTYSTAPDKVVISVAATFFQAEKTHTSFFYKGPSGRFWYDLKKGKVVTDVAFGYDHPVTHSTGRCSVGHTISHNQVKKNIHHAVLRDSLVADCRRDTRSTYYALYTVSEPSPRECPLGHLLC